MTSDRTSRLRILYMGRLDRQKGIDRLYGTIAQLRERGIAFEAQAIGGEILADDPQFILDSRG